MRKQDESQLLLVSSLWPKWRFGCRQRSDRMMFLFYDDSLTISIWLVTTCFFSWLVYDKWQFLASQSVLGRDLKELTWFNQSFEISIWFCTVIIIPSNVTQCFSTLCPTNYSSFLRALHEENLVRVNREDVRSVSCCYILIILNMLLNQMSLKWESKVIKVLKQVSRQIDIQ